jgi:hypothetical protein
MLIEMQELGDMHRFNWAVVSCSRILQDFFPNAVNHISQILLETQKFSVENDEHSEVSKRATM